MPKRVEDSISQRHDAHRAARIHATTRRAGAESMTCPRRMLSCTRSDTFGLAMNEDFQKFVAYLGVSDTLIEQATKEEIAEVARVLALHVAHFRQR